MNGYRTLIFNAMLAAWGVVESFDFASVIGNRAGYVMIAVGAIGSVLRLITTTPVGGEKA